MDGWMDGSKNLEGNKQTKKKYTKPTNCTFFEVVLDDTVFVNILFRCLVLQVNGRATLL